MNGDSGPLNYLMIIVAKGLVVREIKEEERKEEERR